MSAGFCEKRRRVERSETKPSGALLFGYFLLGTQEKVDRRAGAEPRIEKSGGRNDLEVRNVATSDSVPYRVLRPGYSSNVART